MPFGCSDLFTSTDWFYWSKISVKFFIQSFFCWLLNFVYHIFTGSAPIDPGTFHRMWLKSVSGTYTNRTYGLFPSAGLWKVVARVLVFITPVALITLIGFKEFPQVIQVWSCVSKCRPIGSISHNYFVSDLKLFSKIETYFNFLTRQVTGHRYHTKLSKIKLVVHPDNIEARKMFYECHGFKVCTDECYLGGYMREDESKIDRLI